MHLTVPDFLTSGSFQGSINHIPVQQDITMARQLSLERTSTAWKVHPVAHRLLLQRESFQVRISVIVP